MAAAVDGLEAQVMPAAQSDSAGSSVLKLQINVRAIEVIVTLTVDKIDAAAPIAQGDPDAAIPLDIKPV